MSESFVLPSQFQEDIHPFPFVMSFPISAIKRISFALLAFLAAIMALTTFTDHWECTQWNADTVYHSSWFAMMWGFTALFGMVALVASCPIHTPAQFVKRVHIWLFHASFVLILCGAGLTAITAKSGRIHLRTGITERAYIPEGRQLYELESLPFTIRLKQFAVDYHPGTHSASNYVSTLCINEQYDVNVSMNQVATVENWRFYQQSFDTDAQGTTLSVRRDPWGLPLTYGGYTLLFIASVWLLITPYGGFRKHLRQLRTILSLVIFITLPASAQNSFNPSADMGTSMPRTLSTDNAEAFGRLYVAYNGRICPIETLANDFCLRLTGATTYNGLSAEQVMCGWLFWPEDWKEQPIIHIKQKELRQLLNVGEFATVNQLFTPENRLLPYLNTNDAKGHCAAEINDLLRLTNMLEHDELLPMFPVTAQRTIWLCSADSIPISAFISPADHYFIQNIINQLRTAARKNDNKSFTQCLNQIADYQQREACNTLPSAVKLKAEHLYNSWNNLPTYLSRIFLLLGVICLLMSLKCRWGNYLKWVLAAGNLSWALLTIYLLLRCVVSGRLPVGNGHETMLLAAWTSLVIGIIPPFRHTALPMLRSLPYMASGFFLLVASLSQSGSAISQLMPVLQSPLLSLHVSLIMLAYALLSFTFLLSAVALFRPSESAIFRLYTQVLLYPALTLLATGIFIGAIWANNSWGRYWGWDPKEVWALITLLVYAFPLHSVSLPLFRRHRPFFIYLLLAFSTVLMTYFGVNYLLGGLHSYA